MKIFSFPRFSGMLLREHAHVQAVAFPDQLVKRTTLELGQPLALTVPDVELRHALRSRKLQKSVRWIVTFEDFDLSTGSARDREACVQCCLIFRGNVLLLYISNDQFRMEFFSDDL